MYKRQEEKRSIIMAYNCTSYIPSIRDFPQSTLITLRAINSCIALLNIFGNGLLIYALKKTRQTTSFSIELIALMSLLDCIGGIQALFVTNLLLWKAYDSYCYLKVISQLINLVFLGSSFTTVMLIAFDRFLHTKYLQRYPTIMTKRRGRMLFLSLFLFNIMLAFTFSNLVMNLTIGSLVYTCIAMLYMVTVIALYYKTIKAVKNRVSSMHSPFMKSTMVHIRTLANVALSISICMALLLIPFVISAIVLEVSSRNRVKNETDLAIFKWFAYIVLLANGVCSCVIFTSQNKPVKNLIKSIILQHQIH